MNELQLQRARSEELQLTPFKIFAALDVWGRLKVHRDICFFNIFIGV